MQHQITLQLPKRRLTKRPLRNLDTSVFISEPLGGTFAFTFGARGVSFRDIFSNMYLPMLGGSVSEQIFVGVNTLNRLSELKEDNLYTIAYLNSGNSVDFELAHKELNKDRGKEDIILVLPDNPYIERILIYNEDYTIIELALESKQFKYIILDNTDTSKGQPIETYSINDIFRHLKDNTKDFNIKVASGTNCNKVYNDYLNKYSNIRNFINYQSQSSTSYKKRKRLHFDYIELTIPNVELYLTIPINKDTIGSNTKFNRILNAIPKYKEKNFTSKGTKQKSDSVKKRIIDLYNNCRNEIVTNLTNIGLVDKDILDLNPSSFTYRIPNPYSEIGCLLNNSSRTKYNVSNIYSPSYSTFDKLILSLPKLSAIAPSSGDPAYDKLVEKVLTLKMYGMYLSTTITKSQISMTTELIGGYYYRNSIHSVNDLELIDVVYLNIRLNKEKITEALNKIDPVFIDSYIFTHTPPKVKSTTSSPSPSISPNNTNVDELVKAINDPSLDLDALIKDLKKALTV